MLEGSSYQISRTNADINILLFKQAYDCMSYPTFESQDGHPIHPFEMLSPFRLEINVILNLKHGQFLDYLSEILELNPHWQSDLDSWYFSLL